MSFNFPDAPTVGQIYEPPSACRCLDAAGGRRRSAYRRHGEAPVDGDLRRKNEAWSRLSRRALVRGLAAPPPCSRQLWYERSHHLPLLRRRQFRAVGADRRAAIWAADDYVRKSGDTMTGDLAAVNLSSSGIVALAPAAEIPCGAGASSDSTPWTLTLKARGRLR
jgi:hypothetical protein